jgi:hypothetical protein
MIVLQHNRLTKDFLKATALANARAILKVLFPEDQIRLRSRQAIDDLIDPENLVVEPREFRSAMWRLMDDGYSGSFHIALAALGQLNDAEVVGRVYSQQKALAEGRNTIETGSPLDIQEHPGEGGNLSILYLGEAEAELYDPSKNYDEVIQGEEYTFKAYRHTLAPVISKIKVGSAMPYASIITRAIHQGVTPTSEVEGLRSFLENQFSVPFPPLGGIAEGVHALWGNTIVPRKYDVEEADGTRATVSCASGKRNQRSQDVEDQLRHWDLKKGSLRFDDRISFRVDIGRALFSFGAKTTRDEADEVIHGILAAA